ncbi:hypothetical protein QJS04_geneDACA013462 [Acorus gramineus]|uniref:RING-type domain-containing protein n=1 Tax=Acorus gramineus TaxID=55184 RepID=A0AAV9AGR0_ACOGR|nr:hypothetical protein QJS04_geneDACA013462 [Acorus gramineus]
MCTICRENFSIGMEIVRMPCGHMFDGHCISKWLERSGVCPVCRFKISGTSFLNLQKYLLEPCNYTPPTIRFLIKMK